MKFNKKLMIISGLVLLFLLIKNAENFVNWNDLSGFNNEWGDHENANVGNNFKPTKVSDLKVGCDEKRGTCIHY